MPPITSPRLLPAPDDQAAGFVRQRDRARQAIAQDYVELIADLMREEGEARPVDLARRLGVSQATVTATVARLQRDGLVQTKPYRAIFLTEEGQAMADESAARHQLVVRFFVALGVPLATAEADAEGVEHHLSRATLAAFSAFVAARDSGT